jgi:hypothetical protein
MLTDEWQPIETAPRDGTPILLCHWEDEYCLVGEWWVHGWWSTGPFRYAPNQIEIRDPIFLDFEPTHWMPLPPPPMEHTNAD